MKSITTLASFLVLALSLTCISAQVQENCTTYNQAVYWATQLSKNDGFQITTIDLSSSNVNTWVGQACGAFGHLFAEVDDASSSSDNSNNDDFSDDSQDVNSIPSFLEVGMERTEAASQATVLNSTIGINSLTFDALVIINHSSDNWYLYSVANSYCTIALNTYFATNTHFPTSSRNSSADDTNSRKAYYQAALNFYTNIKSTLGC